MSTLPIPYHRPATARQRWWQIVLSAVLLGSAVSLCHAQNWKKDVIYDVITDRFFDGDANNNLSPLYDSTQADWKEYWGGDLKGLQDKLPYLQGMGVTAIWISPPMENVPSGENYPSDPFPQQGGYHGYWAYDFMRVEPHFGDGDYGFNNSTGGWTAFNNFVTAAHNVGIKVIVDFPANDTSDEGGGEYGALYNAGTKVADYPTDTQGIFHHNGDIPQNGFSDRYMVQYLTLEGLADLNQENSTVDSYLKTAMNLYQSHGVDGFRIDAVKHVTWGWEYSMANNAQTSAPCFLFGEWAQGGSGNPLGDPLYHDSYKFANNSGISLLNFPLQVAMADVFEFNNSFTELDNTVGTEGSNFNWQNDQVNFIDSRDVTRFLTKNNNTNRLHEAMAFEFTTPGIPDIYYGDEQYLHNDTNGTSGNNDPYNRNQMTSFSTTTTAYNLIGKLSALRTGSNDAVAYGTFKQRWINSDVYIYERQFFNDVVLVAINKNDTTSYPITGLYSAIPAGTYSDYLSGLLGGFGITVSAGSGGNNPVTNFTLPAHTVAIWTFTSSASAPQVGSIGPTAAQAGLRVTVAGKGFGTPTGTVLVGTTAATVLSWSDTSVDFRVPSVADGAYQVTVKNSGGTASNTTQLKVLGGKLIPVTFTVNNASPTNTGDYIFLTGAGVELGNWGTTFDTAIGPMLCPNYPSWFLNVSVPAGQTIQFKFIKIAANGTVTWENGSNHTYTVPTSGVGYVNVNWQY